MKGIHYLMDEANNQVAVQIDLTLYKELWEDFYDSFLVEMRKDEESDDFNDFVNSLTAEGLLDEV
jgi:hypothetical protein